MTDRQRVAFQGEPGAYSEEASLLSVPGCEPVPLPSLRDVFESVANKHTDLAVVPVENSQAGSIHETYDLLLEYAGKIFIRGEHELRVRHCLLGVQDTELDRINKAYSHPQALAQAANWLRAHNIQPVAYYDTAGAAKLVSELQDPTIAAVASRRAAEVWGLRVLAADIEDNKTNRTRFVIIGRSPVVHTEQPSEEGKTTLVFSTPNKPGALYHALGCFAENNVNLTKIESRPSRGEGWEYIFYVDCQGWVTDQDLRRALDCLNEQSRWVKVLGSYPKSVDEANMNSGI